MTTNRRGFRSLFIAVAAAAPLAIAGCGGGSSMTTMEEPEPLTIPDGFAASSATPVTTTSTTDTMAELLPNPANLFVPLMSMFSGDPSAQSPSSELTGDIRVKTVSSDGNNGFHVTYEVGGEESTIHFEADDYLEGEYYYAKEADGLLFHLATWTDSFEGTDKNKGAAAFRYFDVNNFGQNDETTNATDRSFIVYGARTDGTNLPAGSASYIGHMTAQTYPTDDPSIGDRDRMRGSMRLTADFDESTLEGMVFSIRVRRAGEDAYSRLSDTTYFAIMNGRIVDGQFTAALTGEDSNESATMDSTVMGYEGNALGEFYGPAAEEAGAVLNATRSDRVLYGWLGGWQPDPDPHSGLHRSTADPVFATQGGGDVEDLYDSGAVLAPLTSTLETSRNWSRVDRSGDTYVKTISSDGNDGIRVTYVAGGEEQMIHYLPEDYIEDEEYWSKNQDEGPDFWFGGGGDYYDTGGLWIGIAGGSLQPFWTAGARTDAADLPAGTATYVGSMRAEALSQVDSSSIVRYGLRGDLSLTADFDASTLEGEITNIDQRWREPRPRVWIDLPGTTRFDITDGQIADGQFTATLTGVDRNESAPLHESVRGYEGDVLGEFYGPAAEEVGGVISATRDADLRVMGGTIRGRQQ